MSRFTLVLSKEETNTDRAGLKHPFGVDLGDAGSLPADKGAIDVVRVISRHHVLVAHVLESRRNLTSRLAIDGPRVSTLD